MMFLENLMIRTFISRKVHLGKTGDSVIEWSMIRQMLNIFSVGKFKLSIQKFMSSKIQIHVLNRSNKVQLFWEGHKNLRNLPHGFDIYLVSVKTMRKIAQIFVAFSEKLNFNKYNAMVKKLRPTTIGRICNLFIYYL